MALLNQTASAEQIGLPGGGRWRDAARQKTEVFDFSEFRGITMNELKKLCGSPGADPKLQLLRRVILLSVLSMNQMNMLGEALPNDRFDHLVNLMTLPSARTIVLSGEYDGRMNGDRQLQGCGLIITEEKDIPDLKDFPPELRQGKPLARGIRLFVLPEARHYGAAESSTTRILDEMVALAPGKRILGKLLVGPLTLHPIWFDAPKALIPRGWEDSGIAHIETVKKRNGESLNLHFKLSFYPPETNAGLNTMRKYRERYATLNRLSQEMIASTTAYLKLNGGLYVCEAKGRGIGKNVSHVIASLYRGSFFIDANSRQQSRLANLRAIPSGEPEPYMGEGMVDAFIDYGSLAEAREPGARFLRDKVRSRAAQLKDGGYIIATEEDQKGFKEVLGALRAEGFRIISAKPYELKNNPGQTAYTVIGQKVANGEGVQLICNNEELKTEPSYLTLNFYEAPDGTEIELPSRGDATLDLGPLYRENGQIYFLVKGNYPRGITRVGDPALDGAFHSGYLTEQIGAAVPVRRVESLEAMKDAVAAVMEQRACTKRSEIKLETVKPALKYFPSPFLVDEEVSSVAFEMEPKPELRQVDVPISRLKTSGVIMPIEATQLLRGCQAGAMLDARVERVVYHFLHNENGDLGPWIGEQLRLGMQTVSAGFLATLDQSPLVPPPRKAFSAHAPREPHFLEIYGGEFAELDASGNELAKIGLELIRPAARTGLSTNTLTCLPVMLVQDSNGLAELVVGFEDRDSAAAQRHTGNSAMYAAPSFKLPKNLTSLDEAYGYTGQRLLAENGIRVLKYYSCGGAYYSSPGITAELMHPAVVEIDAGNAMKSGYKFFRLKTVLANMDKVLDGNLLTLLYRLDHAFHYQKNLT